MDKYSLEGAFGKIESASGSASNHIKLSDKSIRQQALEEAIKLTCGERDRAYGPPTENLHRLAELVKAYLGNRPASSIQSADVAAINILIKLSRLATNPTHHDSWIDAAAYAAIGRECSQADLYRNLKVQVKEET